MADAKEKSNFKIKWFDRGREAQCAPNPQYPDGIDVEVPGMTGSACFTNLEYPAKRCGYHRLTCRICGIQVRITTAGRPDDPRSAKIGCLPMARG